MTTLEQAARQALETLERASDAGYSVECDETITALREALEQAAPQPAPATKPAPQQEAQEPAPPSDDAVKDAARYRFLAGHCRSTSEHWGGRWSIVVDGPAPKSHDSEDDFDAAVDAAIAAQGGK